MKKYTRRSPFLRFEEKIIPEPNTGCFLWLAATDKDGYGVFQIDNKKSIRAHRAAWILFEGEIPADIWVLHKCDNPACVNVGHLYLGLPSDNSADRKNRARAPRGENNKRSKLKESDVIEIRRLVAAGEKKAGIARKFGVDDALIGRIFKRIIWRHVP